jgi:hypothetical protein
MLFLSDGVNSSFSRFINILGTAVALVEYSWRKQAVVSAAELLPNFNALHSNPQGIKVSLRSVAEIFI